MTKRNIYFGSGKAGEELSQSFEQLSTDLGFDSPSALCQYMARNHQSIIAMLQQEYNGVDLQSLTEFIKCVQRYDTEQLYALIANRPALDKLISQSTTQ